MLSITTSVSSNKNLNYSTPGIKIIVKMMPPRDGLGFSKKILLFLPLPGTLKMYETARNAAQGRQPCLEDRGSDDHLQPTNATIKTL